MRVHSSLDLPRWVVRWLLTLGLAVAAVGQESENKAQAPAPPPLPNSSTNLDVEVVSYGIGAPLEGKYFVRSGQWVPVLVKLTLHTGSPMEVELHCESRDLDGDYVSFVERGVTLTPGSENQKRVWLYTIAQWDSKAPLPTISVHDVNGGTIARGDITIFSSVSNDTFCVLDVSERPVTRLRSIGSDAAYAESGELGKERPYMRHTVVGRMPYADLPDRWYGLESIDALVWDEPDLSDIGKFSSAQIEALKQWVAHGGTLIVGLGSTWSTVRKTPLADILPVKGDGAPVTAKRFPNFFARFTSATTQEFSSPIDLAVVQNHNGIPVLFDRADGVTDVSLIVEGKYGSGRVVCTAAPLRMLTNVAGDQFFRYLLDVQPASAELAQNERESSLQLLRGFTSLFDLLTQGKIDFRMEGARLDLGAMAFVVAYGIAATLGSWWWLRKHNLTQLSWSVFAVFAVAASALSLLFVVIARGGSRVESIELVDLDSGSGEARAYCWFGMRAGNLPAQQVALPGAANYLRPLARGNQEAGHYATPQRYTSAVDEAALINVPLRAAAKQFEGEWEGQITGSIRTQISVDRGSGQIDPASWIKNDLNSDLQGGILIYLDPRGDAIRPFGTATDYRQRPQSIVARQALAVEIQPLKAGAQIAGLNAEQYRTIRDERMKWEQNTAANRGPMPDLDTLFSAQQKSIGQMTSTLTIATDPAWNAAFLLSTRNLSAHVQESDYTQLGKPITTRGLTDCDVSHWISQDSGVLIAWSYDPGPVQLHADGRAVRARRGFTVYRVRVPISVGGSRSAGGDQ
ncbi:MAG: hypothetical protein JNG88_14080 [Phycisphaerales bacterium]|nr:hypothetical protein [Phycisphaerales bacterium]